MSHKIAPRSLTVSKAVSGLVGEVFVPGDKSISHRALMLSALAAGTTTITGLLEGEDVLRTAKAVEQLGAGIERGPNYGYDSDGRSGIWRVRGVGPQGVQEPSDILDMGNSGTAARLLAGILASHPIMSIMTGDESLRRRPMGRVSVPLAEIGAHFLTRQGGRLPLAIAGTGQGKAITYRLPVASAQIKSAILLAGLNCQGKTMVEEPVPTRDHTENMLRHFGVDVEVSPLKASHETTDSGESGTGRQIVVSGPAKLVARDVTVPGDPSSAAFLLVAASLVPNSAIVIKNIGLNPLRTGILTTLREMGAALEIHNEHLSGGEKMGDLHIRYSTLKAVDVPAERAPSMIDEYPVLAVACAAARGRSRLRGLAELRVKESDRLAATVDMLEANGVSVTVEGDDLLIEGTAGEGRNPGMDGIGIRGGGLVRTHMDHRLAMSAIVMGLAAENPVAIDDIAFIETSFPGFVSLMNRLGAGLPSPVMEKGDKKPVIAIDGPAGVGKGTLARALAEHLCLPYLDTGLLYRAVARRALERGINLAVETSALEQQLADQAISLERADLERHDLRAPEIDRIVSLVARQEAVRSALLAWQKDFVRESGGILDGRDIGTVVFPQADIKFYITASPETRARRRYRQRYGEDCSDQARIEEEIAEISARDKQDSSRKIAPLKAAEDAVVIATDALSAREVLELAQKHIHSGRESERKQDRHQSAAEKENRK